MDSFEKLIAAFVSSPVPAMLVLALIALAWLYRESRQQDRAHAEQVKALYEAHTVALQTANAAHLQTAMQVAPLATKLVTCVEVLERVSFRSAQG